ncbi:MAG: hypothetical protein AAFX94_12855, partial [Myxococcota bacterium]
MKFDELPGDVKAESGAGAPWLFWFCRLETNVALKDLLLIFEADPDPFVDDRNLNFILPSSPGENVYSAPGTRVFYRVGNSPGGGRRESPR